MPRLLRLALCLCVATLAACDKPPTPPAGAPTAGALPRDPQLAKLYGQTCKACHTNPGSGAPQVGDRAAWQPRLAQGMNVLIEHAVNGYKGMPPLGSCMDCNEKDFDALIRFMSGQSPA